MSAAAVVAAAVFAYRAWRDESTRESVRRVGEAIAQLTSGEIAEAREDVTSWVVWSQTTSIPEGDLPRAVQRDGSDIHQGQVRQRTFLLLWALQRLAALWADVDRVSPAQREVLRFHINQIIETLRGLDSLLEQNQRAIFSESAMAAQNVVAILGERLEDAALGLQWSVSLAGFSTQVVDV